MNAVNDKVPAMARLLRGGVSTIVLGAALATMMPAAALAQTAPETEEEEDPATPTSAQTDPEAGTNPGETATDETPGDSGIIVTGQRRALETSQNIKRNADTLVDSITATDIGAFPDKSVAEALQRVPGITVNRFAASDDTAHFSAEPSGVLVRGLGQVRSEFNGRDTFSANSSRGLSWGDVSPELMAGVDTYKNQTAEMIEGGIAGSINLRTRVPFDADGQLIQGTINLNYGDISKKITPEFSAFYSNRFDTGAGEFGIMGQFAYSKVQTGSQGIQYGRVGVFEGIFGPGTQYIPSSVNYRDNVYDRERKGVALAGQWRSNDRDWLVTAQFNRSEYENRWQERAFSGFFFDLYGQNVRFRPAAGSNQVPRPAPGTPAFTFDEDGNFQTGVFTRAEAVGWWGCPTGTPPWGGSQADYGCGAPTNAGYAVNDEGEAMFPTCYSWAGSCPNGPFGWSSEVATASRYNENKNMTQDAAINLKWKASDRISFNFDAQYVDSKIENYDIEVGFQSFANVGLDATGTYPRLTLSPPLNVNQSSGGLANPNNWYLHHVMDHIEDSEGQQVALRGDMEYDFDSVWLDSLKVGARFADRNQDVRWSGYNWANVSNTWTATNAPYWNLDSDPSGSFKGYPNGFYDNYDFGGDFFGGDFGNFPFVPFDFLKDRRADEFSSAVTGVGQFTPICDRPAELADSCFTPSEVTDVSEQTRAVYAMLRFGGPDAKLGSLGITGNVGLRYVETINQSTGFLAYASPSYNFNQCPATPLVPGGRTGTGNPAVPPPGQPPIAPFPAFCYLTPADLALASGGGIESTAKAKHRHFLPSFNVRVDLSDTWLIRFAASRALSRPDIGLLKNYLGISQGLPAGSDLGDPRWIRNAAGVPTGVNPTYTASAFNPFLAPTTAWQFDLSLENYFANVGSFSLAAFYKKFDNYIQYGGYDRDITINGETRTVQVRGPLNGDGAEIRGFEVAYQRFFDFLPQPLDGLGIQANYTFIDNKGITNSNVAVVGGNADTTDVGAGNTVLDPGALEGLSKHAFNLVGMYEKGPIAARVAYNWRSKYLVTAVDCCVYLPVWQEGAGFLDASIRLKVNDHVELSLQGSNLLNTKTVLRQQATDENDSQGKVLVPNGWFQNDRRFVLGARFRF